MAKVTDKRVAILVDNYVEQPELEKPLNALQDNGYDVTVIAVDSPTIQGMHHADMGDVFHADALLDSVQASDYDALILPGGVLNADKLRVNETVRHWAAEFLDTGKLLAVMCHAPWVLVSADAVEGLRITGYHAIRDDVVNAGGEWVDLPVVIEGNLISSRQPSDLPAFIDAILRKLSEPDDLYSNDNGTFSRTMHMTTAQRNRY